MNEHRKEIDQAERKMNVKNIQNKLYPFILIVISIIAFTPADTLGANSGEVYKWTDESGNIHYADIKPNNRESTKIKMKAGKSFRPNTSVQEKARALDARNLEQQQKQAVEKQQQAKQDEAQSLCQAIQNNLKKFEENSRIKINEDGQLRYLTADEITQKKAEFKRMLEENC